MRDSPGQRGGAAAIGATLGAEARGRDGSRLPTPATRLVLGGQVVSEGLLGKINERLDAEHHGAERQETMEEHTETEVREEMKKRRWDEVELAQCANGDAQNVAMIMRLRAETAVSMK
jgi:hypothetical protein